MTGDMFPDMRQVAGGHRSQADRAPLRDEGGALGNVKSIVVDAAVEVGALIDAVCCRCGNWIDWEHYRPHQRVPARRIEDPDCVIRLALLGSDFGLRSGGYIEVHVLPGERVIEADGGYYDPHYEPKKVIDGSLHWHELDRQRLGQVLVGMFDRIMREYTDKEKSDGNPGLPSRTPGLGPDSERLCLA